MPIIVTAIIVSRLGIISFSPSGHLKHNTLDPLRGMAAVGVMAHHSFMMYNLMNGDLWRIKGANFEMPDYLFRFFESLGSIPVSLFFMLTAFLFFERLMIKRGAIDLTDFYFKRALRIIPMYLFMVACVMLLFLCFGINGGIKEFIATIISWSSFSLLPVISLSDKLIGGRAAAGVIWTLAIEWKFYFLIPLISVFTKTVKSSFLFISASFIFIIVSHICNLIPERDAVIILCFMTGMLSAAIYTSKNTRVDAILKSWQIALILSIVFVYAIFQAKIGYTFGRWVAASLLFICISNGNSIFGLLKLEFLRVLGLISYSIYLMHGVIMAFLFGIVIKGIDYSYSMIIAGPMVVVICSLTYANIELRFSSLAKRDVVSGKA